MLALEGQSTAHLSHTNLLTCGFRCFRGPQVNIYVGADKVQYILPKARLLEEDVPFFKAAFIGDFSEATASSMDLPDEEVDVFDLFVEWLFRGTVPEISMSKSWYEVKGTPAYISIEQVEKAGLVEETKPWHKLACMAHRICCRDLELQTFTALEDYHAKTNTTCHPILLEYDFVHMPSSAPLEKFVTWSLARAERPSSEDYARCLKLLSVKAANILVKMLIAKQMQACTKWEGDNAWGGPADDWWKTPETEGDQIWHWL